MFWQLIYGSDKTEEKNKYNTNITEGFFFQEMKGFFFFNFKNFFFFCKIYLFLTHYKRFSLLCLLSRLGL